MILFLKYFCLNSVLFKVVIPTNFSNPVKYLGIHLNQSLTDDNDIMKQVKFLYIEENELSSDFFEAFCIH